MRKSVSAGHVHTLTFATDSSRKSGPGGSATVGVGNEDAGDAVACSATLAAAFPFLFELVPLPPAEAEEAALPADDGKMHSMPQLIIRDTIQIHSL